VIKRLFWWKLIPIDNGGMFKVNFTYQIEKEPLGFGYKIMLWVLIWVLIILQHWLQRKGLHFIVDGRFLKKSNSLQKQKNVHITNQY